MKFKNKQSLIVTFQCSISRFKFNFRLRLLYWYHYLTNQYYKAIPKTLIQVKPNDPLHVLPVFIFLFSISHLSGRSFNENKTNQTFWGIFSLKLSKSINSWPFWATQLDWLVVEVEGRTSCLSTGLFLQRLLLSIKAVSISSLASFLHFVLLFWNHVFTCVSVRLRVEARSARFSSDT